MDRTLVLAASAPLTVGHLVEIAEEAGAPGGGSAVVSITDRHTGVRYQRAAAATGDVSVWHGRVLATTIAVTADGPRTTVRVEPVRARAVEAELALREADAAAEAAKSESDRWGGSDKPPYQEPTRNVW